MPRPNPVTIVPGPTAPSCWCAAPSEAPGSLCRDHRLLRQYGPLDAACRTPETGTSAVATPGSASPSGPTVDTHLPLLDLHRLLVGTPSGTPVELGRVRVWLEVRDDLTIAVMAEVVEP